MRRLESAAHPAFLKAYWYGAASIGDAGLYTRALPEPGVGTLSDHFALVMERVAGRGDGVHLSPIYKRHSRQAIAHGNTIMAY